MNWKYCAHDLYGRRLSVRLAVIIKFANIQSNIKIKSTLAIESKKVIAIGMQL